MPWQRHVSDIAMEVDPDTGRLFYRRVGLLVPRQQGKTHLELATAVHRARAWDDQQISYAAQTRIKAREKWEESHVKILTRSPFRTGFYTSLANGNEAIHWHNGSRHGITAATETSGHGDVLDLGFIDEAWAQTDNRLEQAMYPATLTRPQPQIWDVSTAGTGRSVYLRRKVEQGRLIAQTGAGLRVAYFEWSAPADANPEDPATWRNCMPALGYTITEEAVSAMLDAIGLVEFRRAGLNQWPDEQPSGWEVVSQPAWAALADPASTITGDALALAADVNPERSYGALAVAGPANPTSLTALAGDAVQVEVIEHRAGTSWMVPRIVELMGSWKPRLTVLDPAGPAGSLLPELRASLDDTAYETIRLANLREAAQAAEGFYDATRPGQAALVHLDQAPLNTALAGAQKRNVGDAWLWARKNLAVDICPLVAATLARWGWLVAPKPSNDYDPLASVW